MRFRTLEQLQQNKHRNASDYERGARAERERIYRELRAKGTQLVAQDPKLEAVVEELVGVVVL